MNTGRLGAGDVLVVDDTFEDLTVLKRILEEENYRVRPAINGQIAMRAAISAPPEIILLDIRMPSMSGFEFCRRLKAKDSTRAIPIVFVSALNEVNDKTRAFSLGGVDYITKPYQEKEVVARVKTHLAMRRLQKSLEEKNEMLDRALKEISALQGIVPICAWCKRIRDDEGYWNQVEVYISERSDVMFSHGVCPGCKEKVC